MAPEELAAAVRRQPFIPFRITLTEGTQYEIPHPELCMVGRRTVLIGVGAAADPDGLFHHSAVVDVLHIVKLDLLAEAGSRSNELSN